MKKEPQIQLERKKERNLPGSNRHDILLKDMAKDNLLPLEYQVEKHLKKIEYSSRAHYEYFVV